jgi:hypothetical protein
MTYAYRVMKDIRIACEQYRTRTGVMPNAIYLGRHEVAWLAGMPGLFKGIDNREQDMIDGVPLYTVDKANHLAVGFMIHGKD